MTTPTAQARLPALPDLRYHPEYRRGFAACLDAVKAAQAAQPRKALSDAEIEAGASALVDSCVAKGHWKHASEESKAIYRQHTRAVLEAAHGIHPAGKQYTSERFAKIAAESEAKLKGYAP